MKTRFFLVSLVLCLAGCAMDETSGSDNDVAQKQSVLTNEANRQVGMPNIVNFQEKKILKKLYEKRDQANLITYTYIVDLQGKLHFLTLSHGFGLPYAAQYSAPEKPGYGSSYGAYSLPQAEPNGLYMPGSADGTWILAVDSKGEEHPMYVEPRVIVSETKLGSVD